LTFVIATKDGKVSKTHTGTVTLNKDQNKYSALTETKKNKTLTI